MNTIIERFNKIKSNIASLKPLQNNNIIAVSKTFSLAHIQPLVNYGHKHFGENKVQEAKSKWSEIKKSEEDLKLHMIGKLQSNKAKDAVNIFDYIHSLDNQKLVDVLAKSQLDLNKNLKYFIQVNVGNEIQKSGIPVKELDAFYTYCSKEAKLNILGLMIIPPIDEKTKKYFEVLKELSMSLELKDLSMGMSSDYIDAINCGATFVRIGTSIFGKRD
jgi:PLP dependent protein